MRIKEKTPKLIDVFTESKCATSMIGAIPYKVKLVSLRAGGEMEYNYALETGKVFLGRTYLARINDDNSVTIIT